MGLIGDVIKKGFELARDFIDGVANRIKAFVNRIKDKIMEFCINMVDWLERTYEKIEQVCKVYVEASQVIIKKTINGLIKLTKNYSVQKDQWRCDTVTSTKEISENDVPPEIRKKAEALKIGEKADVSREMRCELELVS